MTREWIDISLPVSEQMIAWPGDPSFRLTRVEDMDRGGEHNLSEMALGVHAGTHVDAPLHYLRDGASIDQLPVSALIGPARVLFVASPGSIGAADLAPFHVQRGERILLRTANSNEAWHTKPFDTNYVHLSEGGALYLAEAGIEAVGIDALSVGAPGSEGAEVHRILLSAGIWIIEGLNLTSVPPGPVELVCLPLSLRGAEAAPARAALRPLIG